MLKAKLKLLAKRALPYLPTWLQRALRQRLETQRIAEHVARKARTQVSVTSVLDQLAQMSLTGDLIVHGSVSNIGKLDKPVPTLVNEWLNSLDLETQTVLVPALPYNTTMREYLADCTGFDVRTARNAMGAISKIVMEKPNSLRSVHPTHSVVAIGADAAAYTCAHQLDDTPFGTHSPYWRITKKHGKVLMIGVGLNSVTCFHVYEDMLGSSLPFNVYLKEKFEVDCINSDGMEVKVTTSCHDPRQSVIRDCERARPWLIESGAIKTVQLGESELSVIDAHLFTKTLLERLMLGQSIYGKIQINNKHREAIQAALNRLSQNA
ncbi:AAC(3) family N-acetyltransferase [Roseateles sp. PN1]|uniref:AAC(3) family N-acetyltransferase n=1 Tax=Roseateles sp. PN1 TaxID=3137372 RepID=UPI00313A24DB